MNVCKEYDLWGSGRGEMSAPKRTIRRGEPGRSILQGERHYKKFIKGKGVDV